VFYFEDERVKYGLPIMPDSLDHPLKTIVHEGFYSARSADIRKKNIKEWQETAANVKKMNGWLQAIESGLPDKTKKTPRKEPKKHK
jgi:hypothetical protein